MQAKLDGLTFEIKSFRSTDSNKSLSIELTGQTKQDLHALQEIESASIINGLDLVGDYGRARITEYVVGSSPNNRPDASSLITEHRVQLTYGIVDGEGEES